MHTDTGEGSAGAPPSLIPPAVRSASTMASALRRRVVEDLAPGLGTGAGGDRGDVALGRAHVPPPATGLVAVGRAADRGVVAALPVQEVVAALVAGTGPVRHLVPGQPGGGEAVVGDLVLGGLVVVVGGGARARGDGLARAGCRIRP